MNNGKWFLVYDDWDSMESWGHEAMLRREELVSTDEASAVAEARAKWEERLARGTYDAGNYAGTYPRNPRLIYEVRL